MVYPGFEEKILLILSESKLWTLTFLVKQSFGPQWN